MAFSSTDLTSVETAIKAIIAGSRVVEVTVAGKTTRYQAPQIEALLKLRDQITTELSSDYSTSGSRRVSTTIKSDTW